MSDRERLVVVGGGMAGARLVDLLLAREPRRHDIAVVAAEPWGAYNRILLSSVLAGDKTLDDIVSTTPARYAALGVDYRRGLAAMRIDRSERRVELADGASLSYDALVVATGSRPLLPPIPGAEHPGVLTFRDVADVQRMVDAARRGGRAVVIGGGLLGLEAAAGLTGRGMSVTVLHLMPWLMERQLDADAGAMLRVTLEKRGLHVDLAAETLAIERAGGRFRVVLRERAPVDADVVVIAIGIRPETGLARDAGLDVRRGVVVDDNLATSDPSIFALGECAEHRGSTFGLLAPIYDQCATLADRLCGGDARYEGSTAATSLKVSGVDLYSTGAVDPAAGDQVSVWRDPARGSYRKLVWRGDALAGAVLYGDAGDGGWYADLIRSAERVDRDTAMFGPAFAEQMRRAA